MKLISDPHLEPRLRKSGAVTPLIHIPSWQEQDNLTFTFTAVFQFIVAVFRSLKTEPISQLTHKYPIPNISFIY
jgi:hypothetical protein